jgi:hypothetical protein
MIAAVNRPASQVPSCKDASEATARRAVVHVSNTGYSPFSNFVQVRVSEYPHHDIDALCVQHEAIEYDRDASCTVFTG